MEKEIYNKTPIATMELILSIIRHQLGNSVNALKITLDVLKENYDHFDDIKKKDYLNRGIEVVGRQQKMIEGMKYYSMFNIKEKSEMIFIPFWERFLSAISEKLAKEKISFKSSCSGLKSLKIIANNIALNKVMMNLVENSIEALDNKDNPEIRIRAEKENGSLIIKMNDNGHGIKEKDFTKIFIPLFTTKPKKMGMGLPVAHKLLSEMGGRIAINSKFNTGTESMIWLEISNSL